jgi:hypothetical protein
MMLACGAAAVFAGCQARQQPFADVPATERGEMAPLVEAPEQEPHAAVIARAEPAAPAQPPAAPPAPPAAPAPAAPAPAAPTERAPAVVERPAGPQREAPVVIAPKAERLILTPADATLQTPAGVVIPVGEGGELRRAWPVSAAYLPSGDVLAHPTYWPTTETAIYRSDLRNTFLEPLEFVANTVLLPIRAIRQSPLTPVVYSATGPAAQESLLIGQPWAAYPTAPEAAGPVDDR